MEVRKVVRSQGARVTDSHELPAVGAGDQTKEKQAVLTITGWVKWEVCVCVCACVTVTSLELSRLATPRPPPPHHRAHMFTVTPS